MGISALSGLRNPLWIIPIEVLELFTLNLMQVASATLAFKLAPKTLVATAQSLVWLAHFDIGKCIIDCISLIVLYTYTQFAIKIIKANFNNK